MIDISPLPLTKTAFAPFGQVIEKQGATKFPINNGQCLRFHDLAKVEATGPAARVLINIFQAEPRSLPLTLDMVERHPFGSQAFIPLSSDPFLVIVCPDEAGRPGTPQAFVTQAGQGVNYAKGTWHGVLTPLGKAQNFVVVDRGGDGKNVQEFHFPKPYRISARI